MVFIEKKKRGRLNEHRKATEEKTVEDGKSKREEEEVKQRRLRQGRGKIDGLKY